MSYVSYIVTYRSDGSLERRANLEAVLRWATGLPDVEVVVVEQDVAPGAVPDVAGVRWMFCYNPGPFNKSWGFNVGAKVAASPVLAFGDGDVICDVAWSDCVRLVRDQFAIAKPYRRIVDLTPQEAAQVRQGEWRFSPARPPEMSPNREGLGEYIVFAGGLFLARREIYNQIGGFDERFRGWGAEDDAMTMRLTASGAPMGGVDLAPALHLWHPRTPATTSGQPFYAANCALLAEYRGYSREQMERLWEVQRQVMGDSDKYRPEAER